MFSRPRSPVVALLADSSRLFGDARAPREEDLWDAWVYAADDARRALQDWHAADADDRGAAHLAYQAALDREEQAAHVIELRSAPRRRA